MGAGLEAGAGDEPLGDRHDAARGERFAGQGGERSVDFAVRPQDALGAGRLECAGIPRHRLEVGQRKRARGFAAAKVFSDAVAARALESRGEEGGAGVDLRHGLFDLVGAAVPQKLAVRPLEEVDPQTAAERFERATRFAGAECRGQRMLEKLAPGERAPLSGSHEIAEALVVYDVEETGLIAFHRMRLPETAPLPIRGERMQSTPRLPGSA